MSEELLQRDLINNPEKIGKWDFYNIGSTTVKALKENGIIRSIDYGKIENKKPDALLVQKKNVIAVVEYKKPSEFNTKEKQEKAIKQELEVAQKLDANIFIVSDKQTTIWINPLTKNKIKDESGKELTASFDVKNEKLPVLLEKIIASINEKNDQVKPKELVNPTDLAKRIWQIVWSISGATPESCLYSFVELFIFKYLSDLKVLEYPEDFDSVIKLYESKSPEYVIDYYARNVRRKIKEELFPKGDDGTTIINGTVFVNNENEAIEGRSTAFQKILKEFQSYGKLDNIHPDFKSQLFESFLKESLSQKKWGQYFTPLKVVQATVEMAKGDIKTDYKICDPAGGVGKFLLEAIKPRLNDFYKVEKNKVKNSIEIFGFDIGFDKDEQKTIILAKANMLIYFSELIRDNKAITAQFADLFNRSFELKKNSILGTLATKEEAKYDLILSNPPYVTNGISNIKEEIKRKGLSDYYNVNSIGLEGLFMEWIIKALKPNGKAFIVVPDGIFYRNSDKNLRQFIIDECFIDALISLPLNTFFSTNKKTYILCLTKKIEKKETQQTPIFTYLVSEIGESRDVYRFNIEQDDLSEAVNLFSFFKGNKLNFDKINSDKRCKVFPFSKFVETIEQSWTVDKWWTEEEKIEIGISEKKEKIGLLEFSSIIEGVALSIKGFQEELIELSEKKKDNVKRKLFKLKDLFDIDRGKSKYTKKYGDINKGNFPVYSASNNAPLTFINTFDYDGKYLTWATNGFAGYVMLIDSKFSINADRGLLKPKFENINIQYIKSVIEPKLRDLAKGRKGEKSEDEFTKVYPSMIENIEIEMFIDENGSFDIEKQNEIAEKYEYINDLNKRITDYKKQIEKLNVEIEQNEINKSNFKIDDLFDIKNGNSKLTQNYVNANKGEYVIYSANTKQNGVFGHINSYDFNVECIQLTTNGVYAGTFFYREKHKFSINGDARLLLKRSENLDYYYLLNELKNVFATYKFNWENKPTIEKIKPIEISIPINSKGEFDLSTQKEIAEKYHKIEQIKKNISEELDKILKIEIEFE
ncbi:MAG: N-6 DNA methylase [Bacteroidales bacterium]|jgi:type I restriction-modification system DNA methylase subunit|nr:N-6 DNA methylase [Bacteroidales bacterium]